VESIEVETRDGLQRITLDKPRMTIGRLPGNDIVLPFTQISRHHAELRQRGDDWWILDLGSTNGLHIGKLTVKEYLLKGGDSVQLAPAITLHFISQKQRNDITVEGTAELAIIPKLQLPLKPGPVVIDPFERTVDDIAGPIAMPLPRRRMDVAPPPSTQSVRPVPPPASPFSQATPPLTDDMLDAWLHEDVSDPLAPPQPAKDTDPSQIETPFARLRQQSASAATPNIPAKKPILYICPTCGERTAPDSPYCWSCRSSIAKPCRICQLYLLPIQARCPRCDTPNSIAIKR